jgi:hypothetical protein
MSNNNKVLGQLSPAINVDSVLYPVPALTQSIGSTLYLVNRDPSGIAAAIRIAVVPNGDTLSVQHYLEYDKLIEARGSRRLTIGMTLSAGDKVYVRSDTGNVSFSLFGVEIS